MLTTILITAAVTWFVTYLIMKSSHDTKMDLLKREKDREIFLLQFSNSHISTEMKKQAAELKTLKKRDKKVKEWQKEMSSKDSSTDDAAMLLALATILSDTPAPSSTPDSPSWSGDGGSSSGGGASSSYDSGPSYSSYDSSSSYSDSSSSYSDSGSSSSDGGGGGGD